MVFQCEVPQPEVDQACKERETALGRVLEGWEREWPIQIVSTIYQQYIQFKLSAGGAKPDIEKTPKCTRLTVSLPHDSARPCRPKGGFGLVIMMMMIVRLMLKMPESRFAKVT